MSAIRYNFVYRTGAAANSPVPSFWTCALLNEISVVLLTAGDQAYQIFDNTFWTWSGTRWDVVGSDGNLEQRVLLLEFLVASIIQKGFGGF